MDNYQAHKKDHSHNNHNNMPWRKIRSDFDVKVSSLDVAEKYTYIIKYRYLLTN